MPNTPALTTFTFSPTLALRAIDIEGSPWFVAKDVCSALDLPGYASNHTARLDKDEVRVLGKTHVSSTSPVPGLFDKSAAVATLINESGLYSLILKSRKPEAKRFKKWVTSEVLPTIRKTGQFSVRAQAEPLTVPVEKYAALVDEVVKLAHQCMDMAQQALQKASPAPALPAPSRTLKITPKALPVTGLTPEEQRPDSETGRKAARDALRKLQPGQKVVLLCPKGYTPEMWANYVRPLALTLFGAGSYQLLRSTTQLGFQLTRFS